MLLAIDEGGVTMAATFLSIDELIVLTGRKVKSKQVESLRRMGLPFFVNASGRPVVPRTAVEGKSEFRGVPEWKPNI
jgi:hypothetical protein